MYVVGCAFIALYLGADHALLLVWMGSAMFYYIAAGNDLVTTLYALVQIITTVGYGDFTPETDAGKVAVTFIVLLSSVIIGGIVVEVVDYISKEELGFLIKAMKRAEECLESGEKSSARIDRVPNGFRKMVSSLLLFIAFLLAGTLYYGIVEQCTCSFGKTRVEGCVPESCRSTGGIEISWQDAIYMSVITLSTVGFGDYSANTWGGRLFGIFWMLFGVAAMVNFVSSFAIFLQGVRQTEKEKRITKDLFQKFDEDDSGTLDKLEFLKLQLQLNDLVDSEVIDSIMKQFSILDKDESGGISLQEVKEYYHVSTLD